MKALLAKALNALRHPSTYKGIATLLALVGVKLAPDQADAIATAGVAIVGAISLFLSDSDVEKK